MGEVMTAIHEAVHSTGYATRLNRNLKSHFGSAEYAYEELIAELGSLIVTLTLGGEFKPDLVAEENANNVAYLQSWLKACKDKDKALNKAFGDAQKAADYILSAILGGEEE
jgi:antirestriction protein ArdC